MEELHIKISNLLQNGELPFPYHKSFMNSSESMYENLKDYKPKLEKGNIINNYSPRNNFFRISGTKKSTSNMEDYWKIDGISDHFNEEVRISGKRKNEGNSPLDTWKNTETSKILVKEFLNDESLKNKLQKIIDYNINELTSEDKLKMSSILYKHCKGPSQFKPTWIIDILSNFWTKEELKDKKWLDISAGYGDRLIVATLYDCEYHGYDPNIKLEKGLNKIIEKFGNKEKQKITISPFEEVKNIPDNYYDFILTSMPFYVLENYDSSETQSIKKYPEFDVWMVKFLFESLFKAWNSLKIDGYLIIHMADSLFYEICEKMNLFIRDRLINSEFDSVITVSGESKFFRPVWIWKKTENKNIWWKKNDKRKKFPKISELFFHLYPKLNEILTLNDGMKLIKKYSKIDDDKKFFEEGLKFEADNDKAKHILKVLKKEDDFIKVNPYFINDKEDILEYVFSNNMLVFFSEKFYCNEILEINKFKEFLMEIISLWI
uniref:Type I restriction-modification system methyltransferase n=1 Tax=Pithovirus LCPAC104 TaxID=2506589 RepID=A0A481Z431_9VIRU|nr:MAG: type I restriction-modification system methyltransferase [Pithovirus LCPAC104]